MKKDLLKFVVLLAVALGAQPAYSALWQWSKIASNNAGADPTINYAEGMSPSAVNDSARAAMARTAEWRDDISGSVVTAGTSTAYTLATNQAAGGNAIPSPPSDGQMLAFRAHATNGAAPTMTVDGGTTYPIQISSGNALSGASLIAGTPYRMSFNLSALAWVMEGSYGNPYSIPLGGVMWSTIATPPNSSFVAPSGQCISTTTYASYWVAIGSPASGGCPGGQFAVIDMRGRVTAALDTLNASAANRLTSSGTGCGTAMTSVGAVCANGSQSETLTAGQLPANIPYSLTWSFTPAFGTSVSVSTSAPASTNVTGGSQGILAVNNINTISLGGTVAVSGGSINPSGGTAKPRVMDTIGLIPYLRVI